MRVVTAFLAMTIFSFGQEIVFPADAYEKIASNKGGTVELKRFYQREMIYPPKSLERKVKGTVTFSFMVDNVGKLQNIVLKDSVNEEVNNEALRLLNLLVWDPSVQNKQPIESYLHAKFRFSPKQYKKKKRDTVELPPILSEEYYKIYEEVDKTARMINGDDFIRKNLTYPAAAKYSNTEGEVKLRFVIEKSGNISNIHVISHLGAGCNEEAKRVLGLTSWHPATHSGKKVRSWNEYSISFRLNSQFKDNSVSEQR